MKRVLAIDFGTTNSVVAIYGPRGPEVIKIDGRELMPSVVTVALGKVEVGHEAARLGARYPDYRYHSFKRHLAEVFNPDEAKGAQMVQGEDGLLHYDGPDGFTYSPVDLTRYVLEKLRWAVDARLKTQVTSAVICHPASAGQDQQKAIREAAARAGFDEVELMDEPTAAAIAYGYTSKTAHTIAVIDVGGGTTDCSFIRSGKGKITVLAKNGTPLVGGDDWDKHLRGHVINLHQLQHPDTAIPSRTHAMQKILQEAELTKKRLSEAESAEFRLEDIDKDKGGEDVHMIFPIHREIMDELTSGLLAGIRAAFERTAAEAKSKDPKFTIRDIDSVIMVGGMARVHAIQQLTREFFGKEPKMEIDPETAVALGAAVRAGVIEGRKGDLTIGDITAHAYALETHEREEPVATLLVEKGTPYGSKFTYWLSRKHDDQRVLTFRLLEGEEAEPGQCRRLWEHQIQINPDDPKAVPVRLDVEVGPSGEPFIEVAGTSYGRDAA